MQYGVRADANHFLATPARNEDLLKTFGLDNAATPNRVYVSPRVGMQWYYGRAPEVAYVPGAARPPRAVIHAGVGVFQNIESSSLISPAVASTGLANRRQSITCVGAATPAADWNAFLSDPSTIPTRCADGSTGSPLGTSAPNVTLFDPGFRQAQSMRAAADWSGPIVDNRFVLGVQSIVSSGRHQQGEVDINLDPTTRFTLADEGDRPIFVDPCAIVPTTGAMSTVASRVSPAFQHVWVEQSDLTLASKQVSVDLNRSPRIRGCGGTRRTRCSTHARPSADSRAPRAIRSTVGRGPGLFGGRHTFSLAWYDFPIFDVVYVSAVARVASGARYTPMIAGDVNGDGMLNDRAFIADPSATRDTALAASMRSLLASTTSTARQCLERQLNTLAGRGSCQAPWTVNGGLIVKFNPQKIRLPKRATVTLTLQNPLALADLALHRSRRPSRLGPEHPARSEPALRARLRSGGASVQATTSISASARRGRNSRRRPRCRS